MGRTALISEKRFTGRTTGGFGIRPLPIPRLSQAQPQQAFPIPLELELAFGRGEIPGRSYKEIVDQAIKVAAPNTSLYNQLLKEQSKAIKALRNEEERAITEGRKIRRLQSEAKAATTPNKTVNDAVSLYNFWVGESNRAYGEGDNEYYLTAVRNAGNASDTIRVSEEALQREQEALQRKSTASYNKYVSQTAKSLANMWNQEDQEFTQRLADADRLYNERKITSDMKNKLKSKLVGEWVKINESRATYLQSEPDLEERMPEKFSLLGSSDKLNTEFGEGKPGLYDLKIQVDRPLKGSFVSIADPVKGVVDDEIAPADLRTDYIQDEYGTFHKLEAFVDTDEGFVAVFNVLRPDGSIVKVYSQPLETKEEFLPGVTPMFFEGDPNNPIMDLGEIDGKLSGRLALTGANINDPAHLRDFVGLKTKEQMEDFTANASFKKLGQENPELAKSISPEAHQKLAGLANQPQAEYLAKNSTLVGDMLNQLGSTFGQYQQLRKEGLLENNPDKLRQAAEIAGRIPRLVEPLQAEIAINRALPIVTPRQSDILERTFATQVKPGNIKVTTPTIVQARPGAAPTSRLGPVREIKPIVLPKATLSPAGSLIPAPKIVPQAKLPAPPSTTSNILKDIKGYITVENLFKKYSKSQSFNTLVGNYNKYSPWGRAKESSADLIKLYDKYNPMRF